MLRVRAIDTRMLALQRQGRVGFYGPASGQEATPVAVAFALEPDDWVFPALREGAVMLVRGFPLDRYLAQVFGNELDVLRGRQMPSHMSGRVANQVSWSSCIGTQLPHAVGAAYAMRLQKRSSIALAFLGDGATSTGDFHSALNFAGVLRTPTVFVCQNNQYAISLPVSRQSAAPLCARAEAYAVPSEQVDGNDALAVYEVVRRAVSRARSGGGPSFIEALTYRVGPHSSSDDPTLYRSEEERERWLGRDPVARLGQHLREHGLLTDALEQKLRDELEHEISEALARAEAGPRPPLGSLFEDVYCCPPWHIREELSEALRTCRQR
jgi:pyruvate dehydrogenase E1 component alpha subunit/2-oxoisovalerate dehydrogenase E1 component alpha subunit